MHWKCQWLSESSTMFVVLLLTIADDLQDAYVTRRQQVNCLTKCGFALNAFFNGS